MDRGGTLSARVNLDTPHDLSRNPGSPNPATTLKHYAHLFDSEGADDAIRLSVEKHVVGL